MAVKQSTSQFRRLAAAGFFGTAFAVLTIATASSQDAAIGDAANGKRLYLADGCYQCHGRAGQGGAMNYQTPALAQLELPVESFVAFLRAAPNDMPAYSASVLSDKDAADIHAFLRSLPGRKPTKDFPLLNQ
jgi:mono/diheme cytochrome c family protein